MSASTPTVVLTALTRLMTEWSSPRVQVQFARDAGIEVHPDDIPVLYLLGGRGACRAAVLADALRLSRPTMSKQLQRLEHARLITRRPDPSDGRASIVTLSDAGHVAHDALVSRGLATVDAALDDWPDGERERFAEGVQLLVDNIITRESQSKES
jgi:DNA-binding MarR family transcriptional regulator